MRSYRSAFASLAGAIALITQVWPLAGQAPLPLEPPRDSGNSVTGAFEGWYQNRDGTYNLLVGYFNRNLKQTFDIPVGPNNRIEPGGPDQGQPTHFLPRRQWGVFVVTVPEDFGDKKMTWTLVANGQTTSVPLNVNPLWIVTPFKDLGVGNTPPVLRFQPGGPAFQGPPEKIAASYTTSVGQPLTLTVWATDDGVRPADARPRTGPPANAIWSKFRGPGDVTFDKDAPTPEADGKTTARATFSAPGEYTLRVQSNDATGDGGGGFQCCWTNAHVKVTVTAGAGTR